MASHMSCFQTEKTIYPPVMQKQVKGHGVMSSYEKHLLLHDFVIPVAPDPQPLPTHRIPIPMEYTPSIPDVMGDPDLCLSPERPIKKVAISPRKPTVHQFLPAEPVHISTLPSNVLNPNENCGIDIDVRPSLKQVVGKDEKTKKSAINMKENEHDFVKSEEAVCSLTKPVYHSTVVLGQQLQSLRDDRFDAERAVLKVLQSSEATQYALSEKVAETVNVPVCQKKYSGLISVDVPIEETVSHVIEEQMSKVKIRPEKKSKEPEVTAPDILEFFTHDLQEERADWNTSKLPKLSVPLESAPDNMAFDLYRHMQWWEQH